MDATRIPWGIRCIRFIGLPSPFCRLTTYRISILVITYTMYVNYHLARRPLSVVKNVLHQNCTNMTPRSNLTEHDLISGTWCQWAPFNENSQQLFAVLDFVFRLAYAVGMFIAGYVAERMDLRLFVTFGMTFAGLFAIFNGMAYFWDVHSFSFFVTAQILSGLFQGTGWPSVVSLMWNWFGQHRIGIIFGIWNSHTSVGNILGAVIAGVWVNDQWGYSFVVPGLMIILCAIIAYLFVVVQPSDIGLPNNDNSSDLAYAPKTSKQSDNLTNMTEQINHCTDPLREPSKTPISFMTAFRIPGVLEFSFCLFFAKAVYYTFFFWLPVYIKAVSAVGNHIAADLSAVFDAGGIVGGILAGAVSDATGGSATVCGAMFLLAIPSLYCMVIYVEKGVTVLIVLLIITGLFVNGPYALITTAVSTDLGTRPTLAKSKKSLATVVAVIDGMGSLGSALGPLGAGLLSVHGWDYVFYYLIIAQVIALLCLTRLIYREIVKWYKIRSQSNRRPTFTVELIEGSAGTQVDGNTRL